jgi:hypothetical protein
MTHQQRRIADYIAGHPLLGCYAAARQPTAPFVWPASPSTWTGAPSQQLASVEELCGELLEDAEFRALALGGALGSTEGQVISEAVSAVIPPEYRAVFDLAVGALTLAAQRQCEQSRRTAGGVALAVVGAGLLMARLIADR